MMGRESLPNYNEDLRLKWDKALDAEHKQFGDILVEDFNDSYQNLTIKTVMMLKFLHNHNGKLFNANYILKVF